ncbi:MAG TPA: glycosyltransferase [Planctomycetota bacterium]|nr:glycosyltransferase [Planctomycetota bacterium]
MTSLPELDDDRPVALIFRSPLFNPSETFVQAQAAGLHRYQPLVVGMVDKGGAIPELAERLVVATATERLQLQLGDAGALARRLAAYRPRLVHAHFGTDGLLALPLARALGVPLVTSLRGYDVQRSRAALLRSGRLSWMRYALAQKRLMEEGALFLAVSDALRDRAIARGFPDERTLTHYNGVDLNRFAPSPDPPAAVLRLAKRWAEGRIDKIEGAPLLHDVTMGLLHLAETQAPLAARGDKPAKEVMRLLDEQLLTGKSALLPRFVKAGSRGELGAALGVLKRCRQMPDEIVAGLRKPVQERFPDLAPVEELPFWEGGAIFCSREGLARRREEYRVLMHEKIPANSEDIGRAASYGDLSENFEWTAAIEQQRQLTEKAATIEAELKLAQAIEDQKLPPGVVAPGTRVTFEQDGQSAQTVRILGPWDVGPDVMSYRAPLAAGMLGAKAGETVQVTLPAGVATVRVVAIEPVAK